MSQPLMKQADGQGPDHTLRRHLAWRDTPPTAARARAEADALLSALHRTHQISVARHVSDDVRLVVSELIANAARHAPGPGRLEVQAADRRRTVRVSIWDSSPVMPLAGPADPRRVGGHGLEIVKALSSRLLVRPTREGKQITAELHLDQTAPVAVPRLQCAAGKGIAVQTHRPSRRIHGGRERAGSSLQASRPGGSFHRGRTRWSWQRFRRRRGRSLTGSARKPGHDHQAGRVAGRSTLTELVQAQADTTGLVVLPRAVDILKRDLSAHLPDPDNVAE